MVKHGLATVCGKMFLKKKMQSKIFFLTKTAAQCLDSGIVQSSRKVCIVCLTRCPYAVTVKRTTVSFALMRREAVKGKLLCKGAPA